MRKTIFGMTAAALVISALSLMSCSDKDNDENLNVSPQTFSYQQALADAEENLTIPLDSLDSPVKSIANTNDWITASATTTYDGLPAVKIVTKGIGDGSQKREGKITVTAENGNTAIVSFTQHAAGDGDAFNGSNDENWFNNWENVDRVMLSGIDEPQYTPWADNAELSCSPDFVSGLTKKNGWEMVFSILNDPAAKGIRYFGLYNRFLGTLRVFCYVDDPGTTQNEAAFEVRMGVEGTNRYPFYNGLAFSIPTSHSVANNNLNLSVNIIDAEACCNTFHDVVSPYTESISKSLKKGWNIFDVDCSGYVPNNSWREDNAKARLYINCVTQTNMAVSLSGKINAGINGTYRAQEVIQHGGVSGCAGAISLLKTVGNIAGGIAGSGAGGYAKNVMDKRSFESGTQGGPTGWNNFMMGLKSAAGVVSVATGIASGVLSVLDAKTAEWYDTVPGKINLTMNGTVDLKGTIKGFNSNKVGSVMVTKKNIDAVNGTDGYFGKGILSLAEDPVICVAKEDIMAEVENFNLTSSAPGKYQSNDFASYGARLISFLDPTSIKLNLNTELYGGVRGVCVSATYAVIPAGAYGYTLPYCRAMSIDRPTIDMSQGGKTGRIRFSTSSTPVRIHKIMPNEIMLTEADDPETTENCMVYKQEGADFYYFGRLLDAGGKDVISQPQVYIPWHTEEYKEADNNRGSITYAGDGVIPDFVVGVTVVFFVEGTPNKYVFTQQYIPKIKLLSHNELLEYREKLHQYQNKCDAGDPVTTLANDPSVEVYDPVPLLDKTLKILDRIFVTSK